MLIVSLEMGGVASEIVAWVLTPVPQSCASAIASPSLFNNRISMACGADWKLISRPQTDCDVFSFSTSSQVRRVTLVTLLSLSTLAPSSLSKQVESRLDCPG